MPLLGVFGWPDGLIVLAYFALVIYVGFAVARRDKGTGEYFLGGRSMPAWAVAISIVATMLSAATFVGAPDSAFAGDISYLSLNIGGIIAVFIVAFLFVPRLYRAGTVTIYGFLAQRFGEPARIAVSCTFIFGRLLASGARLFLAAIPLCLLMFGARHPTREQLIFSICLIAAIGTFYTTMGGVRAVVWVDTIQLTIVVGAAILSLSILLHRIPLHFHEIVKLLHEAPAGRSGVNKLHLLDTSLDFTRPYTLWAAIFAATFLNTAAYGVDHDLAQRFLISRSVFRGGLSVIASQFISIIVVSLFLFIGLLLYIFYRRPDVMHVTHVAPADGLSIYPWFLLNELPTVLSGLSIAGFFAIAQGSLDSAINALASSIVADLYLPMRRRMNPDLSSDAPGEASRLTVAGVGVVLALFAIGCALEYDPKKKTLLDFALGVLTFAFTGMLGVFLAALLTRRGNSKTVIAALLAGALTVTLLQDDIFGWWTRHLLGASAARLAWPWWMPIGTVVSFVVCVSGRPADG